MGLFEIFLTPDDLTEGRGFPQSFHVNARILRTLLFSRFPTNPHRFIFYQHNHPTIYNIHRIIILSGPLPRALHVVWLKARNAPQLNPTPAHARVVDESLLRQQLAVPKCAPHCCLQLRTHPVYLWIRVSILVGPSDSLKPFGHSAGRLNFDAPCV